ncbi:MAG: sigma-70 family RNA polymerase sigma factor [Candidatus Lambdaproteobacteria bacterium]|nr:sigma-70 family RNA polymerase sigma factor [Candidatus Lambdaproteobacteria bacterium]
MDKAARDDPSAALVRRAKAGDAGAFDDLLRRHHGAVHRLVNRMLRNDADAQEITQETFLSAYQGLAGFDGRARFNTWLLAIAYNKAIDRLKRQRRDPWTITGDLDESELWRRSANVHGFTDWGLTPEQTVLRKELRALLDDALAQVPALNRAVFELRDIQGLTSREVAEALALSEGAVRVRLHRTRQLLLGRLRERLNPEEAR